MWTDEMYLAITSSVVVVASKETSKVVKGRGRGDIRPSSESEGRKEKASYLWLSITIQI